MTNTSSAPAGAVEDYGDQEEWEQEWEMGLWCGDQLGDFWHPDHRPAKWLNPPRKVTDE